jgi:uncharacterized membrane protein
MRLLTFATRALPTARREWGQAMRAELDPLEGSRTRRRFSVGCTWAAAVIYTQTMFAAPEPGGRRLRSGVLVGIAAAIALVADAIIRYPGLRAGYRFWGSSAAFLLLLFLFAAVASALSQDTTIQAATARRYGVIGGLAIGGAWFIALAPPTHLRAWVLLPFAVALLGPAILAALAGRSTRNVSAGTQAALWAGIVGGLTIFIVWVAVTLARAGRPYDTGLIHDFHHSGAPNIATYAISDNLGSGLVLLLLVPTVALTLGSLAARLTASTPR